MEACAGGIFFSLGIDGHCKRAGSAPKMAQFGHRDAVHDVEHEGGHADFNYSDSSQ